MHGLRSNQWKHTQQNEQETDEMCAKRGIGQWILGCQHVAGLSLGSVALTALHSLTKGGWEAEPGLKPVPGHT